MSNGSKYTKHLIDISNIPIKDILESTEIPEDLFLKDFVEFILGEADTGEEFKTSVWQIPEEVLTEGVSLSLETERIRNILITWSKLYEKQLHDILYDIFELGSCYIDSIIGVELVEGTQLLIEIETVNDKRLPAPS